ncbi:hypothetical protein [Stenotrophomonas sp. AB1(2024)]|uniref:hypothetical protein n=1 Tax=Stenotrophomonas sp. AB1(2024) TaxID=3132215 RepID=UPI00309A00FF
MSGFIGELLEGIVDFVTDIWVLRRQRAANNRAQNAWGQDAADTAVFNAWVISLSVLALAAGSVMFFMLKLPPWLSLVPVVAGGVYVGYRWIALTRA